MKKKLRIILGPDLVDGSHWSPAPDYLQDAFERYFRGMDFEPDEDEVATGIGMPIEIRLKRMSDAEEEALPEI